MMDFLSFRRMLIPYLIQIIFWAGTALCIFSGVMVMAGRASAPVVGGVNIENKLLAGALVVLGGPIVLRVGCEIAVVLFRMNETLSEMSGSRGSKK